LPVALLLLFLLGHPTFVFGHFLFYKHRYCNQKASKSPLYNDWSGKFELSALDYRISLKFGMRVH